MDSTCRMALAKTSWNPPPEDDSPAGRMASGEGAVMGAV